MTDIKNVKSKELKVGRTNILLNTLMVFVGISGCFSVLFGAWLAHGGQALPTNAQSSLATALQYQFIHTLALFITLLWIKVSRLKIGEVTAASTISVIQVKSSKLLMSACLAFVTGILCFCGVIYIKSLFELTEPFMVLSKLTPLGGIAFAIAWLLLAVAGKRSFN
ncbi:DUF423 domain-containing protein [Colwellia sp. E2M01]|uniref:DUF423 domain-containing protein n=1 Tax=Colwellia sp. E2M01 TaxID=2841561 RepID=UPI001C088D7C|nr:DUF423 domain-containing protein [Colwellia sp. E2M01]MBU2871182.1 DUF423 domain-containing protein [Colwellia sp. E2M01]